MAHDTESFLNREAFVVYEKYFESLFALLLHRVCRIHYLKIEADHLNEHVLDLREKALGSFIFILLFGVVFDQK